MVLQLLEFLPDKALSDIATIAFTIESGWADHEAGDKTSAFNHFETALRLLEQFSDQQQRVFNNLRFRFGQMLGWLTYSSNPQNNRSRRNNLRVRQVLFLECLLIFQESTIDLSDRPGVPYEGDWAYAGEVCRLGYAA